jgi:cobyrinic acid a,c-diamide synthase
VEAAVDVDRLVALGRPAALPAPRSRPGACRRRGSASPWRPDRAFSFVYPHVLAGWRAAGAEIVPFSPLADEPPPRDCDACWLPGGYPELHAGAGSPGRAAFLDGLRAFAETRPVHGECGGYMVLGRSLEDGEGGAHPMAGLLPVETSYARRKLHLGYRVAHLLHDGPCWRAGQGLVGHEFHYASVGSARSSAPHTTTMTTSTTK